MRNKKHSKKEQKILRAASILLRANNRNANVNTAKIFNRICIKK